eukprot:CAMPEP_0197440618 /NCGR_PEP_ID=MMETSP1175-20131217/7067_1 /TAXON_ID=1003142 /ORGANISM="Triceratium dubium, Strain CCMP147" /LENGTH=95 /DNA_ID=CAMNT_0042970757 /DNA_START=336 /DNA_END=623 /DNA_ORIENTATION=-
MRRCLPPPLNLSAVPHRCTNSGSQHMIGSFSLMVNISHPVLVTNTVCSNCALRFPSVVTAVQLSPHVVSPGVPRLIMGSTVNTCPGLITPLALFL